MYYNPDEGLLAYPKVRALVFGVLEAMSRSTGLGNLKGYKEGPLEGFLNHIPL